MHGQQNIKIRSSGVKSFFFLVSLKIKELNIKREKKARNKGIKINSWADG